MKIKVKKFMFIAKIAQKIACLTACLAFSASAAPVAKVGETEYETLEAAFAALSSENYTLTLQGTAAWPAETPVHWAAGTQSGYTATLTAALTAAYKADAGAITIVCRPGADVGAMTHGHVADDLTIYGNNAYLSGGECDLEVDTYAFSRTTGAQAADGVCLDKDITITAYELDNLGVWGQRNTAHTVTVNLTDCDGKALEGKTNVQRVYISGTTGANNITLTDCDFITKATAVYSNANGAIKAVNCSFTGGQVPFNINHKANGTQTVAVENCRFTNCGYNGDAVQKQYAAPLRLVNSGAGMLSAEVKGCAFTDTVGANGDILLGDGRTGETSNDVALMVTDTAANIQAQKPGYYGGETVDATKKATAESPAEGTLETSVAQLLPVDPRTLGYATSGNAEALPATPDMNGGVVMVTPENVQYVLDGAYGSINGKTICLSAGTYDQLVLGRPTKYAGSNTEYRHGSFENDSMSYADFIAYKTQAGSEYSYYTRAISNVKFTAEEGVTVAGVTADGGNHIFGTTAKPIYDYVRDNGTWCPDTNNGYYMDLKLQNIEFDGVSFTERINIATSSDRSVFDGLTFKGCSFTAGGTDKGPALRYYSENNNGNVKNLVVDHCSFQNCSQGVYTMQVNGITVKNSTFTQTGHNAIAIQSQGGVKGPCNHGEVVITGNTMVNIGDRAIRFNVVAAGTTITITGNTATYKDGTTATDEQCIKATTLAEGVTTKVELNNWNNYAVAANKPLTETVAKIGTTDYKSLEDATEAAQDGDVITIVGYTSNMTAPDGWKFETVDGVTTLVADPVLVKGEDGKFHIASYDDLLLFKKMVNEKGMNFSGETVVLDANIDMASLENWTPVGNASEKKFAGTFDGQNHTISGLTITGGSYVGLFGYLGAATVQNVALVGANVSGVKRVGALVGQIAGNATIKNCSLDATSSVTGSDSNTGGLIGEASGSIVVTLENLTNNAPVTNTESGTSRAAGILCQATSGASVTLKNCVNNGTITTNGGYAGGIVSAKQGGASLVFDGCSNTGTLANGTKGTGALLAWSCNGSSVTISNYSGDVANAIGWLSQDNYDHVFVINGVEHYIRVAKGGSGYTFASRYDAAQLMDKSYLQEIIGFFTYAKTVNANFEGYPATPVEVLKSAYNTRDESIKGGLFNTDVSSGWPQLLSQYNATSGKSLTADDFAVTWGTRDVLFKIGDAVAKIGNSYYATLAEAVAAATASQTVTLISDVADAGNVSLKAGVTLDGDGHKVTGNSAVYINKAGGTVQNVVFEDIHNAASKLSAVYASGLEGTATITGCTFDNCDWDAIQATPVAGAVLTITGNVFDTDNTDGVQQQRYVHIQSAANVDFTATVTGNVMKGDTKQGALEAYYFADEEKIDVSHNYIEDMADVCILDGTGALRNDTVFPAYKDAEKTELYQPVAMIATSAYSADYYPTLAAALIGAKSGDTIQILAGTWGADAIGKLDEEGKYTNANIVRYKSLTIQPAEGAEVTFTSTLSLGYDDSSTANATMTVKDLTFDGASLKIANYVQTTVEGCTFVNGANSAANGTLTIIDSCCTSHKTADAYPVSQVTVTGCSIDGSAAGSPGIRIRNSGNVTITGNVIKNTAHNGILFESNGSVDNTPVKTVSITDNAITEWNVGNVADGGRAMRLDFGTLAAGSTVTVEGNVFRKAETGLDKPDFMKITGAGAAMVSLETNDWNDELSSTVSGNSDYYTVDTATPVALNAVVTTKKEPVAQIGETVFSSINAAFAAVNGQSGDDVTIKILKDVTEELTTDYYFAKDVTLATDVEGGVTLNFGFVHGRGVWALLATKGHVLNIEEDVTITNLSQLFGGYYYGDSSDVVNVGGVAKLQQLWACWDDVVNVLPTARIVMGYGDGMIKLRCGTLNVTGTKNDADDKQLTGGYISADNNGAKSLNLKDTYVSTSWLVNSGTGTITVDLDNATLELNHESSKGLNLGADATGTINMKNGSLIVTPKLQNVDVINVDATGLTAPVKVVDYTGAGTMTLADYGTVNVAEGCIAYVEDNDLFVRVANFVAQIGETKYETLQAAFDAATDGDTVEILVANTYRLPTIPSGVTVKAATDVDVVIDIKGITSGASTCTFEGVTFDCNDNQNYTGYRSSSKLVFNKCTFKGEFWTWATEVICNECTFEKNKANDSNDRYALYVYGSKTVTLDTCTFNTDGKAVKIAKDGDPTPVVVMANECTFNSISVNKNAFMYDTRYSEITVIAEDCVFDDNYSSEGCEGGKGALFDEYGAESPYDGLGAVGTGLEFDANNKLVAGTLTQYFGDIFAEGFEAKANDDDTYGVKATFKNVTVKPAVGAETTISVRIPNALMERVEGETQAEKVENLSKADENGNLAWVNLVAGIDSTKKVTMAAPQNDDAGVIAVKLPAVRTAPMGTDVTVHYEIRPEGSDTPVCSTTAAKDLVINLNGQAGIGTYRTYVCLQQNGTEVARVASENALGVLQTVSAAKKTIIAVPWLSLADGNAIAVADLVKTAGLTEGDKLHVYNKAESRYDVYELASDRAWMPKAIYKVGADGTVEAVSSGTPETTTVARGNGVWLERQDTTKAIVSYGQVASGTVETTIDAGTAEKPTWNLLAVPTTEAVNIAATFGASVADKLIVPTAGAPKICTVKDGAWGYEKSVPVTDASGNKLGVKVIREAVPTLPAGTGFWYLNGGTEKTVNW